MRVPSVLLCLAAVWFLVKRRANGAGQAAQFPSEGAGVAVAIITEIFRQLHDVCVQLRQMVANAAVIGEAFIQLRQCAGQVGDLIDQPVPIVFTIGDGL